MSLNKRLSSVTKWRDFARWTSTHRFDRHPADKVTAEKICLDNSLKLSINERHLGRRILICSSNAGPLQERRQRVLQRHQPRRHRRGLQLRRSRGRHPGSGGRRHRKWPFDVIVFVVVRGALLRSAAAFVVGRVEGEGQVRLPAAGLLAAVHWRGNSGVLNKYSTYNT